MTSPSAFRAALAYALEHLWLDLDIPLAARERYGAVLSEMQLEAVVKVAQAREEIEIGGPA